MSELLREVDDAMRQERVEKFFHEHGKTLIAFVALTIFLTGALSFYKYWDNKQKEDGTAALIALQEAEDFPENVLDADLNMRGGARGLAYLSGAQAFLDKNQTEDARTLYNKAAQDSGVPKDIKHLALLMQARLAEEKTQAELDTLQKIWSDTDSPWQAQARLESAIILAATKEDYASALSHLDEILKIPNLPDTFHTKVQALSHVYALEKAQKLQDKENTGS